MMRLMVKETAEARGFRNAKDLADSSGLSYSIVYAMWNGATRRIDLSTLERLCKTLKVGPGVLIHYDPSRGDDEVQGEGKRIGSRRSRPTDRSQ